MSTGLTGTFEREAFLGWLRERINDKRDLEELSLREREGRSQVNTIKTVPIPSTERSPNNLNAIASEVEREAAYYAHQLGRRVEYVVCAHYQDVKRPLGSYAFYLEPMGQSSAIVPDTASITDPQNQLNALVRLLEAKDARLEKMTMLAIDNGRQHVDQAMQTYRQITEHFSPIIQQIGMTANDFAKDARVAHKELIESRVLLENQLSEEEDRRAKREVRANGVAMLKQAYADLKGHAPALLAAVTAGKVPITEVRQHPAFLAVRGIVDDISPQQLPALMNALTPKQRAAFGSLIGFFKQADEEDKARKAQGAPQNSAAHSPKPS